VVGDNSPWVQVICSYGVFAASGFRKMIYHSSGGYKGVRHVGSRLASVFSLYRVCGSSCGLLAVDWVSRFWDLAVAFALQSMALSVSADFGSDT
jgi:hypothetical protein